MAKTDKHVNTQQAESELNRYTARYHDKEDIREEIDKHGDGAEQKGMLGALKKYWTDIKDVVSMLRDVVSGTYKEEVPFATLAALTGAVAYIACPIDLIPDVFPVIGLTDDALVFAMVLQFSKEDLKRYRLWRIRQCTKKGKRSS